MSERWKPEIEECYFSITDDCSVIRRVRDAWEFDNGVIENGNCFKTKAEAEAAAKKVKALLLSLHDEPVTNCKQLPKLTAEVFNRPDCPEWANYAAVDADGGGFYYEDKPRTCEADGEWLVDKCIVGTNRIITGDFDPTDWQNSLIERPAKLPEWCKVGEWVYLSNEEYDKIESIDGFGINLASGAFINKKYIHEEAVSARLRPYNADEMKALVGKVLERHSSAYLVISYAHNDLATTVYIEGKYLSADNLLRDFTIAGKSAGVLEHLENGEWVE